MVSSANSSDINLGDSGKSLMYRMKRSGPKIDPWGTPRAISSSGLDWFFTFTNCLRFVK